MRFLLVFLCVSITCSIHAQLLTGTVRDGDGKPLPFSTILLKGTPRGVTANAEGRYAMHLDPGAYVIIGEHVGYAKSEKDIVIKGNDTLDFRLDPQQLHLNDIVIHSTDEDPAYAIIRHAIHERPVHKKELDAFSCEVYSKGQAVLNAAPKRFMGQKIPLDSSYLGKNNLLYLSETVARYAEAPPDKQRVEVISSKVSGQSDGYGLTIPYIISFYTNVIIIGNMNARGFISPIADGALHYYKYKLVGTFFEDGRMIDQIRVTPRRLYEPCFSGFISIVDGEWRIHSTDLKLLKTSQLQFLDTFHIEQLYSPLDSQAWIIRSQVGYFSFKLLGFDAAGSFANTYSDFDRHPLFPKGYFGSTQLKYDKGSNKKPSAYWDTIRPVPLSDKEMADYHKKDSLEKIQLQPKYLDSVDKATNRITAIGLILTGVNVQRQKRKETYTFSPLLSGVGFNTVEGLYIHENFDYKKQLGEERSLELNPDARYGFSNRHFNASLRVRYSFSKMGVSALEATGGRTTFQYDPSDPISTELNSAYTLFDVSNYMKIYEASFGKIRYTKELGKSGLTVSVGGDFEDRASLSNTDTTTYWVKANGKAFTPNFPTPLTSVPMPDNKATSATLSITYHPGMKYIEFPEKIIPLGSKYPTLRFSYTKGISGLFGSTADYDKWKFTIEDDLNLKIAGLFKYSLGMGGFLNNRQVALPDYNHFNGDQTLYAGSYLGQFQLAPYYLYSNTTAFYAVGFIEHHFNGLLTNKIPLFRRLNWFLVGGVNALYLSDGRRYTEVFGGLENILKVLRVDYVAGFPQQGPSLTGVRIGLRVGPN